MTRPLRIGIFVVAFPVPSETFIVTKVLKLLENGFDVHLFTLTESKHWDRFGVLRGRDDVRARVHVVPPLSGATKIATRGAWEVAKTAVAHPAAFARYVAHTWKTRDETPLGFLKSLYQRVRFVGHELDILHIEFDSQGVGIADLREYLGCRLVYSARGTFQHSLVLERMPGALDYLFKYVDGYHFISKFVDANTHAIGLPDSVPTWLIPPAIDLSLFAPAPRSSRPAGAPLRIISVGRLAWTKGYEFAIDAAALLRHAGVPFHYTIYGEGPYDEALRYAIHQHGLGDQVTLAGALPREQVAAIYADADVMVHTALAEAFSNAVIEAQAMEVPVVTSDAGGLPENVEDGVTGFVVPRRDARAVADKLALLAADPALRARLGAAGRKRALEHFDLEHQAEAFVQMYREVAALPQRTTER
jgi:colanic acid/amylovoran biosynthesis glycosyltransferase